MSTWTKARSEFKSRVPVTPAWSGTYTDPATGCRYVAGAPTALTAGVTELLDAGTPLGIDTETCGTTPQRRRQVKCVTVGNANLVVLLDPRDAYQLKLIRRVLAEAPCLIFHNSPFDVAALAESGIAESTDFIHRVVDTVIPARWLREWSRTGSLSSADLATALAAYLPDEVAANGGDVADYCAALGITKAEWFRYGDIDLRAYALGAMNDVRLLPALFEALQDKLRASWTATPYGHWRLDNDGVDRVFWREQYVNRVFLLSTFRGVGVNASALAEFDAAHADELAQAEETLRAAGIIDKRGTRRGHRVTAALVKEGLVQAEDVVGNKENERNPEGYKATAAIFEPFFGKHELATAWLTVSRLTHTRKDYLQKVLDERGVDGRIRPTVSVGSAVTGRMAYSSPPLQQFNKDARPIIAMDTDPKGCVSIDFSAIEPMVAALMSGQTDYFDAVVAGGDAYIPVGRMAGLIPEDIPDFPPEGLTEEEAEAFDCAKNHSGRKQAKKVILGLLYGTGEQALAEGLSLPMEQALAVRSAVFGAMGRIHNFLMDAKDSANRLGSIITGSGRIVPVAYNRDRKPWQAMYRGFTAQNYICQGTAYDILAEVIAELYHMGLGEHIQMAIHDELIVDASVADQVTEVMEQATKYLERVVPGASQRRFVVDAHSLPTHWKAV